MRQRDVALVASENGARIHGDGDALRISQLSPDLQTFHHQGIGRGVISLLGGQHACRKNSSRTGFGGSSGCRNPQDLGQAVAAFGEILVRLPETKQGGAEAQPQSATAGSGSHPKAARKLSCSNAMRSRTSAPSAPASAVAASSASTRQ